MGKQIFWDNQGKWVASVLIFLSILWIVDNSYETLFGPGYTIQDVYVYCGKNPEVLITHRGDDCNITMNKIYGENENWTRWRNDDK